MKKLLFALIALGLVGCTRSEREPTGTGTYGEGSSPSASTPSGTGTETGTTTSANDQQSFITQAAQDNLAEVELGRLAEAKATDPRVKQFGSTLAKDHQQGYDDLQPIAKKLNVKLPDQPDKTHEGMRTALDKLSGQQFDRAFVKGMIADHEKTIAFFKDKGLTSSDPQVKDYASKVLPILQKHLDTARQLDRQLGSTGATGDTSGAAGTSRTGVPTGADAGQPPDTGPGTSTPGASSGTSTESGTSSTTGDTDQDQDQESNESGGK